MVNPALCRLSLYFCLLRENIFLYLFETRLNLLGSVKFKARRRIREFSCQTHDPLLRKINGWMLILSLSKPERSNFKRNCALNEEERGTSSISYLCNLFTISTPSVGRIHNYALSTTEQKVGCKVHCPVSYLSMLSAMI